MRVSSQREKRLEDEKLRKVKTLGAADDDVDDLATWVTKSRVLEEKAKAEARAKALKQARMLEEQVRAPLVCSGYNTPCSKSCCGPLLVCCGSGHAFNAGCHGALYSFRTAWRVIWRLMVYGHWVI